MEQFGIKNPDVNYIDRPSSYAVIIDHQNRILVVLFRSKYFLPGGGIEGGESSEETIHRELSEEVGLKVKINSKIGTAGEYVDIPQEELCVNKIGVFYHCEIVDESKRESEKDHESFWLQIGDFETGAAHESHYWAVKQALSELTE